jgi:hypothetical protein
VGNTLLSGFGGAVTDCGSVEHLVTLNSDAELYGQVSCYTNIAGAVLNFFLSIVSSVFVPAYLETLRQSIEDQTPEDERNRRKHESLRPEPVDFQLKMLNGDHRDNSKRKPSKQGKPQGQSAKIQPGTS